MYKDFKRWVKGKVHITIIFLRSGKIRELSKLAQEAHQRFYSILFAQSKETIQVWNSESSINKFQKEKYYQSAKKIIFTACHLRKLKLAFTIAQTSFQLAPKAFCRAELISHFFCYSNSSKNITCLAGKLKTDFTSPIGKSTSPGLSDTTFFAR